MDTPPAIVLEHLRISFGSDHLAVKDLSFSISPAKALAIVGESGSGKSLTALALMGLLPPSAKWSGTIHVNAAHITAETPLAVWKNIRGKIASMVFQEPMSALNPVMKVGKQLAEAIQANAGTSWSQAKVAALDWLRKVQIPEPDKSYHKYPHQLSGGQKQRVMIAMAMSARPTLLIADEPTTALDVTVQAEIIQLMRDLQRETESALIFITHDLALAATIADDVLVMRNGEVQEYGTANEVLTRPKHPYTKALLACRPATGQKGKRLPIVADFLSEPLSEPGLTGLRDLQDSTSPTIPTAPTFPTFPTSPTNPTLSNAIQHYPTPSNILLKVRNLRVWFPTDHNWFGTPLHFLRAVEDVSFDLNRGEVLGLVGESGCGKSTISKALMGLVDVESGQMSFEGKDLTQMSSGDWRRMRREVQMIFQDPFSSLNPRLTVGEAIMEPLLVHHIVRRREVRREAQRLMDLVHLPSDALKRYPHQFSGGQRQRIGIARAIAVRPKLIICDESVSALDVSVQAQILNLLKELQAELNLSYLFISHDLNVVHYIADRVLVMNTGKIIERGTADEVLKNPRQAYTKKLIAAMPSF